MRHMTEVRHFKLHEDLGDATTDEIAEQVHSVAKGGHEITLALPNGKSITIDPDEPPMAVAARLMTLLMPPDAKGAKKPTKGDTDGLG